MRLRMARKMTNRKGTNRKGTNRKGTTRKGTTRKGTTRKGTTANHRRLLPVLRPTHNMRDIIKQLALLEDHLFQPQKRCVDCIRKHFLTIEGLAEECATLCKPRAVLPEANRIATGVRVLHHAWEQRRKDPAMALLVASKLRKLRKNLMKRFSALDVNKLPTRETNAVARLLAGHRRVRK